MREFLATKGVENIERAKKAAAAAKAIVLKNSNS
jgi:hypothetical protein